MKVLIIDDDAGIRAVMKEWLEEVYNCEVAGHSSGKNALEKIEAQKPDLLLLDIMLPDRNGLELLELVKKKYPYMPTILFSAYSRKSFLQKAINSGADGFINKPPDFKSAKEKIDHALEKYSLIKENIKLKKQFQESERKYRELVENSRDGFFRLDSEDRIIYVNKKFLEWTELHYDELIGCKFKDLEFLESTEFFEHKTNSGFLYEMSITSKSGVKYILEVSSSWIRDGEKIIGIEGVARNITSRKILEKKIERQRIHLEAILNSIAEGILAYDESGEIIVCNRSLRKIIGDLDTKIIGTKYENFLKKLSDLVKDKNIISRLRENILENPYDVIKCEFTQNKTDKIYVCSAYPMMGKKSGIYGRVLVFHDITDRRLTEKMREDLSEMLVHDLKNPLSATILYTDILLNEIKNERHFGLLKKISMTSQELSNMIMDLLDINKFEENKLELNKTESQLTVPLNRAYSDIEIMKEAKNIEFKFDIQENLPTALLDEHRIYRVLINLFSNALKFTPRNGLIKISAWADDSKRNIFFSVSDTGPGIPTQYQKSVFDKFVQLKSRKEGQKLSTGLGLTYCKLTVEAHGGEIWLDSTEGKGATFLVRLPSCRTGYGN